LHDTCFRGINTPYSSIKSVHSLNTFTLNNGEGRRKVGCAIETGGVGVRSPDGSLLNYGQFDVRVRDGNGYPIPDNPTGIRYKWGGYGKEISPWVW
jgi:hypothetical protein